MSSYSLKTERSPSANNALVGQELAIQQKEAFPPRMHQQKSYCSTDCFNQIEQRNALHHAIQSSFFFFCIGVHVATGQSDYP